MPKDAIDLSTVSRALVIKLRHHGDVLLTSPVFSALKNHAPHVEIDALVYHATQEMLSGHPAIREVYTIDREWKKRGLRHQFFQERRLWRELRARRYDLIVHLTEHARGAWLTRLLRPRYSVAHEFSHKRGFWWRSTFTHLYKLPATPRHTVEQHLDALRRIGVWPGEDERRLTLAPGADAENVIAKLLEAYELPASSFVLVHPTSRWLFKCWKPERYVELIDMLQTRGQTVILTAGPSEPEHQFVSRITTHLQKPVIDLSGQLSLKQLAALIAKAKVFIGVDSVPMHIAAAMQTPVVVLFGPSNEKLWGPWQVRHRVVAQDATCRPCGLDGCGGSKRSECLESIDVVRVLEAVHAISDVK